MDIVWTGPRERAASTSQRPGAELVRSLTDEHVLRALMRHRRLTRAELATTVDISKPTAGESVRRLTETGVVVDTGDRTPGGRGRGRVGSYYSIAPDVGGALAVSIAPEGAVAERVDVYGDVVDRSARAISHPITPHRVEAAVRQAVEALADDGARLAVVSAADPVDRSTGRLVQLPDSPFLVGELDPVGLLAPYVRGPVIVDNDVNWAARAEHETTRRADFAYLYLGEGLGCAIVGDGEVRRGGAGLAGEISHLITTGPEGEAVRLIEVFGRLGLRLPGSTAIDVDRLVASETAVRAAVARSVSGVLDAIVALTDPEVIVLGGPWGVRLIDQIRVGFAGAPRVVPINPAAVPAEAPLAGARFAAIDALRAAIIRGEYSEEAFSDLG